MGCCRLVDVSSTHAAVPLLLHRFTIVFETMTQINEESQFRHVRRFKMRPQWEYFQPNLQKWMSFSESDVSLLQAASQSGGSEVCVLFAMCCCLCHALQLSVLCKDPDPPPPQGGVLRTLCTNFAQEQSQAR